MFVFYDNLEKDNQKKQIVKKRKMKVGIDFYKKVIGKIAKLTKKIIKKGEEFYTPPCLVRLIPEGTIYYEIILEKGSILENRYDSLNSESIEKKIKLVFFEFRKNENLYGENLLIGKKYVFYFGN